MESQQYRVRLNSYHSEEHNSFISTPADTDFQDFRAAFLNLTREVLNNSRPFSPSGDLDLACNIYRCFSRNELVTRWILRRRSSDARSNSYNTHTHTHTHTDANRELPFYHQLKTTRAPSRGREAIQRTITFIIADIAVRFFSIASPDEAVS